MKIYDCWLYWGYFFIVSGINRTIPFIQEAISPYVKHESMLNPDGFASYFAVERNLVILSLIIRLDLDHNTEPMLII